MDKLNESHFSFKCPMNLEDMQETSRGRFCGKCNKEVFDLTNCSLDEVRELEKKHGPLCGSIRVAQVATVAISLAAAACQEKPENRPPVVGLIPAPPSQQDDTKKPIPQRTAGLIRLPQVEEQNSGTQDESEKPPLRGEIKVPPKNEEGKTLDPTSPPIGE